MNNKKVQVRESTKPYSKWDKEAKDFKKQDDRMKYGKAMRQSSLMPGEVRKYDEKKKRYTSS